MGSISENASAQEALALIAWWAPRLGLGAWKLDVEFCENTPAGTTQIASVQAERSYDEATLWITWEALELEREELVQVIVHELVHLTMRDLEEAANSSFSFLAPQTKAAYEQRWEHELEGVVDRLARDITKLVLTGESC